MKKKVLKIAVVLLAMLALSVSAQAQTEEDAAHFGARVQFDLNTSTKYSYMVHWGPGVSAGVAYYAPFGKATYFNVGVLFSYDTFDYNGDTKNEYNRRHYDGTLSMIGMRLPLDFGYKFLQTNKVRLSVYTGPHFYFNFDMKADYTMTRSNSSEKVSKDYSTSGMEFGWGLGFAADINRRWHAQVEGTLGLSNMCKTEDIELGPKGAHLKRAEISVGIGYNF